MVLVVIDLVSALDRDSDRRLGVLKIWNDGTGSEAFGNYKYEISHGGIYYSTKKKKPWKSGRIVGFPRKASPYRLVSRCLKDAGEI